MTLYEQAQAWTIKQHAALRAERGARWRRLDMYYATGLLTFQEYLRLSTNYEELPNDPYNA